MQLKKFIVSETTEIRPGQIKSFFFPPKNFYISKFLIPNKPKQLTQGIS